MGKSQTDLDIVCRQPAGSSFSEVIELSEPPEKFVSLKCLGYKGKKEPIAYLLLLKTIISTINIPQYKRDAMLCKSFSTTQYDSASKWFSDMKPSCITFFIELVRLFMTYYASNKHLKKYSHHLFSMVQNVVEFVKAFMKKVHKEKMEFDYLD